MSNYSLCYADVVVWVNDTVPFLFFAEDELRRVWCNLELISTTYEGGTLRISLFFSTNSEGFVLRINYWIVEFKRSQLAVFVLF